MTRLLGFAIAAILLAGAAAYGLSHTENAALPLMAAAMCGLFSLNQMKRPARRRVW